MDRAHLSPPKDASSNEPYTDASTGYEYASFYAYLQGKDPVPHWRNAQIKRIRQTFNDSFNDWRVSEVTRLYDRQGNPRCTCGAYHPYTRPEQFRTNYVAAA